MLALDGSDAYNMELSQRRAEEVKQYLMQNGVDASDIDVAFRGESDLVHLSSEDALKGKNRRVSIVTTGYAYSNVQELVSLVEPDEEDEFVIEPQRESKLTLSKGTDVLIPTDAFCMLDGTPVSNENIRIQFKEAFEYSDMVDQHLYTQTENQILETGGMIYIEATQNGKPLRLQDGKQIDLTFPSQEEVKEGMQLFTGVEDENGVIWEETGEEITSTTDNSQAPFIQVDLSPLLNLDVKGRVIPSLDFATMPTYPKAVRKPNLPYKGNYTEEKYTLALEKYHAALKRYEQDKIERPAKLKAWTEEAWRRKELLFQHKKEYALTKVRTLVEQSLNRVRMDQDRVSHDRLIGILFSFLSKSVGKAEYDDWFHIRKTFGKEVVHVRKTIGLDFPMYEKMPTHYFFRELDNAIKDVQRQVSARRYEMGYLNKEDMARYVVATSKLGWINCDRFYEISEDLKMDLHFASISDDDEFYLIFKRMKSLIRPRKLKGKVLFNDVPIGEEVRLVAVNMKDGDANLALRDFTIGESNSSKLNFSAAGIEDLKKALEI
ncbi:MAG: OmpA family protein [Bacteroidota bacterium]